MAHPKRRQSKTRTLKRRTHDKAVAPTLAVCPNCGAYYVYHTVCPTCGYYRGQLRGGRYRRVNTFSLT